jgi:hypothetical protein
MQPLSIALTTVAGECHSRTEIADGHKEVPPELWIFIQGSRVKLSWQLNTRLNSF